MGAVVQLLVRQLLQLPPRHVAPTLAQQVRQVLSDHHLLEPQVLDVLGQGLKLRVLLSVGAIGQLVQLFTRHRLNFLQGQAVLFQDRRDVSRVHKLLQAFGQRRVRDDPLRAPGKLADRQTDHNEQRPCG